MKTFSKVIENEEIDYYIKHTQTQTHGREKETIHSELFALLL